MNARQLAKRFIASLRKFTKRLAAPMDRDTIASAYLRGDGIEIGALHNPLPLPSSARVKYVDRASAADLRAYYPELATAPFVRVDIIDDGEELRTIADASQEFVVANHFLEHCQDPIRALASQFRVLKPGGILYLAIPDKRDSFDADRPVTALDHLWRDYLDGPAWSRAQHLEEWVTLIQHRRDPAAVQQEIARLRDTSHSIHYHVWTQVDMIAFLLSIREGLPLEFEFELVFKNRGEVIFVLRKPGTPA
jgi:SAM-dependent methyltransferase